MAHFTLQPVETELERLAEESWKSAGLREHELETAAFDAGAAIREGEHTLANLEAVVRWKSEHAVQYLIANSAESIRRALGVAACPEAGVEEAARALMELRGVDLPIASAILTAIFPDRYMALDVRALEGLGQPRHDLRFYAEYVEFCRQVAERAALKAPGGLPAATPLRTLDHALDQWARGRAPSRPD